MSSRWPVLLGLWALGGCPAGGSDPRATDAGPPAAATPVQMARVRIRNLPVTVSGPGRTDAEEKQIVRAPFNGTILSLTVADGDWVRSGQVIGTMVSRNSQAALEGARQMLGSARTEAERKDARRALELAEKGLVRAKLRVPEAGIVLSHQVDEGSQVNENENLVQIVATDSLDFIAQINQQDLTSVEPGQQVRIDLAALEHPISGTVRAILPSGSTSDLTVPVRIGFAPGQLPKALNMYGVAHIVVGQHKDATVVPAAAVLRNDITGVTRIATVTSHDTVQWIDVETGLRHGDEVQIVSPRLTAGQRVIVSGQVGLPEGAHVREQG